MMITPYSYKLESKDRSDKTRLADGSALYEKTIEFLKNDIAAIKKYRLVSDDINITTLTAWFPELDSPEEVLTWLNKDRDFFYSKSGLKILQDRYLLANEPIQYAMLRIAKLFAVHVDGVLNYEDWRIFYDLLSCCYLHTSSVLAAASSLEPLPIVNAGEACRLMSLSDSYDSKVIQQIEKVCTLVSVGVGVGLDVSNVPLNGYTALPGKIRNGFKSLAIKLNSCNYLGLHERKPKVAIYLHIHNDTIYEALTLKQPTTHHLENVFVGLILSDYFMECVGMNKDWYLFSHSPESRVADLANTFGDEYRKCYEYCVEQKLYSKTVKAQDVMAMIVSSLCESGSPYIIWDDHLNKFNNQQHLGKIRNLNLCAEISSYNSPENSSSCTLLSANMAMYQECPEVINRLYDYMKRHDDNYNKISSQFKNPRIAKFAYMLGYMATKALNNFMGKDRKRREIGISPLGVFDMAIMENLDPIQTSAEISEALYMGAMKSSYAFYSKTGIRCIYYENSQFSAGKPQWALRNVQPTLDWSDVTKDMQKGLSNSMLTSQAPTAITSMLVGVTESVTIPSSLILVKENESGRTGTIMYGFMQKMLNDPYLELTFNNSVEQQISMYEVSAPFVDHSQSTMLSLEVTKQKVFNILRATHKAKLKTGVYYIVPKQKNTTLPIIKNDSLFSKCSSSRNSMAFDCEACTM